MRTDFDPDPSPRHPVSGWKGRTVAQQHRSIAPSTCPTCRTVLAARTALASKNPAVAPTTNAVCDESGLKRRAVQIHSVHLTTYGHLDGGRPTGLPLDVDLDVANTASGVGPTPLEWIASLGLTCETCRCILCEYARVARGGWRGQIGIKDMATRLGLSEWTIRMHARSGHTNQKIGHSLRNDGLIAFRADGEVTGMSSDGKARIARRADRFILNPAHAPAVDGVLIAGDGMSVFHDRLGERLRVETLWFDPTHEQASWVVRLLAELIRSGWPEEVLMEKLRERPHRMPIKLPYRYAKVRLPKIGTPYIVPTPELYKVESTRCTNCRVRMHATPDGLCGECREELARAAREATHRAVFASAGPATDPAF